MATATTLHAVRAALIDTTTSPATGLIPSAVNALDLPGRITYAWGWPTNLEDLGVLLMDARSSQTWRTTGRGRNEAGEVEVLFVAYSPRNEQAAAATAYDMLEAVDSAARLGNGLGGLVEEIALTGTEYTVIQKTTDRGAGSFAYLLATFATRAKIISY